MIDKKKLWFINSGASIDSDAQAFFTAAGITDATQKTAVNTLVLGLKAASLWTPMKAIYPIVGGTATTHKYNLKDPRDLDAAYRITWTGTQTHASTGVLSNGTTGYGKTFFTPSTGGFTSSNGAIGYYSRTNDNSTAQYDMGSCDAASANNVVVISRYNTGNAIFGVGTSTFACAVAVADSLGFYISSRVSATNTSGYKNGSLIKNIADGGTQPSVPLFLLCLSNNTTPAFFSKKECAFAFISDSLSDSQAATLNTLVQAYQTTLGRNV